MPPLSLPSRVGHGALGLRDNLRAFGEFLEQSAARKVLVVEARPRQVVSGWARHSGECWVTTLPYPAHDGRPFAVVDIVTGFGGTYTRAETLADCVATAGTFYTERDTLDSGRRWDDGVNWWDTAGNLWDQYPSLLYVHLVGDKVPNETTVLAAVGLYYSNAGWQVPVLGPEKHTNGSLEAWDSATDATGWSEVTNVGGTVNRESTEVKSGSFAVRLTAAASAANEVAGIRQDRSVRVGKVYRVSGDYMTPAGLSTDLRPNLLFGIVAASQYVLADGRDNNAVGNGVDLAQTNGEWRRFAFDFRAWADADVFQAMYRLRNAASPSARSGSVYFDNVSFRCIHSFEFGESRVLEAPEASTGTEGVFFGGKTVGAGTLVLANGSGPDGLAGVFEPLLALTDWEGCEVRVLYGGVFPDGQELMLDDFRRVFTGIVQDLELTDQQLSASMYDARAFFHRPLPPRVYSPLEFPAMEEGQKSRARPLIFGTIVNMRPTYLYAGANGFGVYEVGDTYGSPNGLFGAVSGVWAYEDEAAADAMDTTARSATSGSLDQATGLLTVTADARIIRIATDKNDRINFKVRAGTERVAQIAAGCYTPAALALQLEQQAFPDAVGAYRIVAAVNDRIDAIEDGVDKVISLTPGDYTITELVAHVQDRALLAGLSGTWAEFTPGRIQWTSQPGPMGTTGFKWATGANNGRSAGPELGFDTSADDTGTVPPATQVTKAAGAVYPCSYNETSKKFTLARFVGAFSVLLTTGANREVGAYGDLGFDRTTDLTGAIAYVANLSGFTTALEQHHVRLDVVGLRDDSLGTYTGSPDGAIRKAPDVARVLLQCYLGFPATQIDLASFVAARTLAPQLLGVVLDETGDSKEVFERIENGSGGAIVIDGDGIAHFEVYEATVPASTPELFDRDFLTWTTRKLTADVFSEVRVRYGRGLNASGGQARDGSGQFIKGGTSDGSLVRVATDEAARLRFGAVVSRDFETYLLAVDDAQRRANTFLAMARRALPVVSFSAKSKIVDRKEGDKLKLTRTRGLGPGGTLSAAVYRIKSIRRRFREGVVEVEAIPDTVTQAT